MKQVILYTLILFLSIPFTSEAQRWKRYRYEILGGIGTTNVFGDLGGGSGEAGTIQDFDIEGTGVNIFAGMRYKLKELVYIKANLIYAFAISSDDFTTNVPRHNRGGHAYVSFIEPSIQFEYSLVKERYSRRYSYSNIRSFRLNHINTYLFIGVGGLLYFPSIESDINTDIGEDPGVFSASFPMGIGFKYSINRVYSVGMELGHRYTTTDYLDGISDNYSKANDSYLFLQFSVSKKLKTSRKGVPRF